MIVGVVGAGTMGRGIAQIAATVGCEVFLYDKSEEALENAQNSLTKILDRLIEKGKFTETVAKEIIERITFSTSLSDFSQANFVIEAIIEDLNIKKDLFSELETIVSDDCILATNTSSLSVAALGAACKNAERFIGVHFFNPAPLMPLVEIIPAISTSEEILIRTKEIIDSWKKVTVIAKDTPGFIVNRVARPFYGEALRIYEEGIADFATIDAAMTEVGGFKMGPFTLMDYIGNDINYAVTETVFKAFYYDPRYKPSFTQRRHVEAQWLGKKSGRGYYDYSDNAKKTESSAGDDLKAYILNRILVLLFNEAIDAVFWNVATKEDIDLAMTKGVNYPKGLLEWADEYGLSRIHNQIEELQRLYGEDRYRPSPLLKQLVKNNQKIYQN
ncbi:MAG: 3-hydroxyacyl-CoA dehydrogenase NAD-binding domain-containing protein [Flavobacteriales bacterium]|nr:3-hydroxyacyl-CoA dehydrogenase NAD-binding domain-containing protein [Flavobacteriales bacterium]